MHFYITVTQAPQCIIIKLAHTTALSLMPGLFITAEEAGETHHAFAASAYLAMPLWGSDHHSHRHPETECSSWGS